jgi:two-component system, chemotaxis family, chemotaxis protein CheY
VSTFKILLIDDSPDLRLPMKRLLEMEGYQVDCAENGQIALEMLRATSELPGLILLDLMMPIMDGQTFRAHQLKETRFSTIPVIVMSASSLVKRESDQLGVFAYLSKPVEIDRLLALTEQILGPPPEASL